MRESHKLLQHRLLSLILMVRKFLILLLTLSLLVIPQKIFGGLFKLQELE